MKEAILVAGSNGAIGKAVCEAILAEGNYKLLTVSRTAAHFSGAEHLTADLSDPESLPAVKSWLDGMREDLAGVIHCAGLLHNSRVKPEKALSQLRAESLAECLSANVLSHVHLAQAVEHKLRKDDPFRWLSISARIGSIDDNRLGGWYSYRMSKAALNMFIKNLSIEWGRNYGQVSVAAMHPGTTYSPLSEPFTANWPKESIFTPELTAHRVLDCFSSLLPEHSGTLYHWDGEVIQW